MAVTKATAPSNLTIVLANSGDKILEWQIVRLANAQSSSWSVLPSRGNLSACGLQPILVQLSTWNLTARAGAYQLDLELRSNSYDAITRTLSVRALVSAVASAPQCTVDLIGEADLTAGDSGDTLLFTVATVDLFGMRMFDVATRTYSATTEHFETITTCKIVYDAVSDEHVGSCLLPQTQSGDFALKVLDSADRLVGNTTYLFSVAKCQSGYYWDADTASCKSCGDGHSSAIICHKNSALEDILVRGGHWRVHDTTPINYVRECPRPENCIGNVTYKGCREGTTGPLCATCASGYVETSALECKECDEKTKASGRAALFLLVVICVGLGLAGAFYKRKMLRLLDESDALATFVDRVDKRLERIRDVAKVNVSFYQIMTTQVTGCITCPWPSAYYRLCDRLGILSLDFFPYLTSNCDFPRLNFYAKLVFFTLGPITVVLLIFVNYRTKVKRTTASGDDRARLRSTSVSTALVFMYVVFPGSSLVVFQTFACVSEVASV